MNKAIFLLIILFLTACGPAEISERIKIGVSIPMTGPAAATGSWIRNGIELAVERLPTGERERIELIYEDDQCNPNTGMTVAQKLVGIDTVKFMVGPLCGAVVNPTMSYYEENKVLRMLPGVGLETNIGVGDYYFILLGRVQALMEKLTEYAVSDGVKTVSILYIDDEYGKDNLKWFEHYFTEKKGTVLTKEPYVRGDTDFRTQLIKIKETNPDGVFLIAYGPTLVNILKQMQELGLEARKFSLINTEDTEIVKSAGNLVEGLTYPSIIDQTQSDIKAWYAKIYLEKYGAPHEAVSANSFDSFNIMWEAIKKCNKEVECVKAEISNIKDYAGASGTFSVDEQRVGIRNPVVKTLKDGKFVVVR